MSWEAAIGLVLGSTVIGGVIGAYAQASRQREERFRDRMFEAAVDFLRRTDAAFLALDAALRSAYAASQESATAAMRRSADEKIAELEKAVFGVRSAVPVLMIVFPRAGINSPAFLADQLAFQLDRARLVLQEIHAGKDTVFRSELRAQILSGREDFAHEVQRAIREPAFRAGLVRLVLRDAIRSVRRVREKPGSAPADETSGRRMEDGMTR